MTDEQRLDERDRDDDLELEAETLKDLEFDTQDADGVRGGQAEPTRTGTCGGRATAPTC